MGELEKRIREEAILGRSCIEVNSCWFTAVFEV